MQLHHFCKRFIYKKFKRDCLNLTFLLWIWFFTISISNVNAYYFGLKSADDTPENINKIETELNIKLPIVSFIFDPRNENDVLNSIDKIIEMLWNDRIYHFTISPDNLSAEQVAMWEFDEQYTAFFNKIKEKNLHVIFRTMHEMNGWWYPRSSNPQTFKAARIHVWTLSRATWLTEENILFDFSINHRDMPTNYIPSQSASLIQCNLWKKNCYHFEDYYPWDEFVDIIWFSFYNRWKAVWNRKRLTPTQILYDKNRKTYDRIKAFSKPIIIDEVATTSVRYDWDYDYNKSRNEYVNHNERKDKRIYQLRQFLINHPEIIATIYFNTDYTHWLQFNVTWEADWAIVNIDDNKVYWWFHELEIFWEKDLDNILTNLFHLKKITFEWKNIFISYKCEDEFVSISSIIASQLNSNDEKLKLIHQLQALNLKSDCIIKSLNYLWEINNKQ